MERLHRAIFLGMSMGIVFILALAGWAGPQLAFATTQDPPQPGSGVFAPEPTSVSTANFLASIFAPLVMVSPPQPVPAATQPPTAVPVQVEQPAEPPKAEENSNEGCPLSARFPAAVRQWCDLIQSYAGQNGLEPALVAAVMLQESGGNPRATSSSGAVGLLQVMPRDGIAAGFQCANGPCFRSRPSMTELYDPEFNIRYGTGMLAGLVGRTGNLREALRSYGPANSGYYYADKVLGIYQSYR
jgi:soluble lytic murein transglycosylase-like protein